MKTCNSIPSSLLHTLASEYGTTFQEGGDRIRWERRTAAPSRIPSAGAYAAVARRMGLVADGRLLAVGWNHERPRAWADGRFAQFKLYWDKAVERPDIVGSCYNIPPETVYTAWRAGLPPWAARAAALLRSHRYIPAGPRRTRLLTQARALKRGGAATYNWRMGADLLHVCGRLSAEEQAEVVRQMEQIPGDSKIRVRHVDWGAVREVAERIRKNGLRARVVIAYAQGRMPLYLAAELREVVGLQPIRSPLQKWEEEQIVRRICPAYPLLKLENAARIWEGQRPVDLAEGHLTRKEAHLWCDEGAPPLAHWIAIHQRLPAELFTLRDPLVVRWLVEVRRRGAWGQLTRERLAHGPAGAEGTYTFLRRIDEIQAEDLINGIRTSVQDAFERAAARFGEAWERQAYQDHRELAPAPRWWTPPCMRWLSTPHALVAEGKDLKHCVGTYAPAVKRGLCFIGALSIVDGAGAVHRSTLEISSAGSVLQHRGESNGDAPLLCQRALEVFLRRNGLGHYR